MTPGKDDPSTRLIVALDVPSRAQAERLVETLGATVGFYKIGYQLAFAGGLPLVSELNRAGKRVFLDLKLLDIANTVEKGIESILGLGAAMTTVHAYPHAMRAAAKAAAGSKLTVLGVTVLTSLDDEDLKSAGYHDDAATLVERRARQAREAGLGGIVCSPAEAAAMRAALGPEMALVTPGIRPAGADKGDQKRVTGPAEALRAGASHLVVGRPIVQADDPLQAARAILEAMGANAP